MAAFINKLIMAGGLWIGLGGVAHADLIGNQIDVQYRWPTVGTLNADLGTVTVTAAPQTVTFQPYFNVTISSSQIVVDDSNFTGGTYTGSFNGEYLIDESVTTFPAYAIDPSSVLTGTPAITIAGNVLEIDFHGLTFSPGDQLVLDPAPTGAPEPGAFSLLGISVVSIGLLRRRRMRG